ncbi:hypothetical protein JQ633_27090 [Bradyrhizobium tropiciagri]|uniref:hypothetical protein n=1 Tax=Bradyrhizobium tropiciagri TaxID=312253 RepID=UPI001BAADCF4|nr:hypothetical protein [Bradyrhizobium tropiciagri]MBR0874053.1 hypothetical protein [Bradyrhizobium tropiciagri]
MISDLRAARFRRNSYGSGKGYVDFAMIYILCIDTHIARLGLRAGRLHAGT